MLIPYILLGAMEQAVSVGSVQALVQTKHLEIALILEIEHEVQNSIQGKFKVKSNVQFVNDWRFEYHKRIYWGIVKEEREIAERIHLRLPRYSPKKTLADKKVLR
jgi:hypothetical protein